MKSKGIASHYRILSVLMALLILFSAVPFGSLSAKAAPAPTGGTGAVTKIDITDETACDPISTVLIKKDSGDYEITGASIKKTIEVEKGYEGTITLKEVSIGGDYKVGASADKYIAGRSPFQVRGKGGTNGTVADNQVYGGLETKVNLVLDGTSYLNAGSGYYGNKQQSTSYAALDIELGAQVTVSSIDPNDHSKGKLVARGNNSSTGIGGGNRQQGTTSTWYDGKGKKHMTSIMSITGGNFIVSSGTIDAMSAKDSGGLQHAAAIGASHTGGGLFAGNIIIYDGIVEAHGGNHGAGIGSGCPNASGNTGDYAYGTVIVALPPAEISATTQQSGQKGLAGAEQIFYVGDPENPAVYIRTEDTLTDADIYFDLTESDDLQKVFNNLTIDHDLSKLYFGTTATEDKVSSKPDEIPHEYKGYFVTKAIFNDPVTIFTDATSRGEQNIEDAGKPYKFTRLALPSGKPKGDPVILNLLDLDIKLEDIPSTPLEEGYPDADRFTHAPGVRFIYNDDLEMTDVTFRMQRSDGSTPDFKTEDLKFYETDGVTELAAPPTKFTKGLKFVVKAPLMHGKTLGIYSDVLMYNGKYFDSDLDDIVATGDLRKVLTQNVARDDSEKNAFIKVKADKHTLKMQDKTGKVNLSMKIDHSTLDSAPYEPRNVEARYIVTTERDPANIKPDAVWTNMNKSDKDNTWIDTEVNFAGLSDDTYYIHWKISSGVVFANSLTVKDPPAENGGYGPYILDTKDLTATLKINDKDIDQTIKTLDPLTVEVQFSKDIVGDLNTSSFTLTGEGELGAVVKDSARKFTTTLTPKSSLVHGGVISLSLKANAGEDHVGHKNKLVGPIKITLDAESKKPIVTFQSENYYDSLQPSFMIDVQSGDKALNQNTLLFNSAGVELADGTNLTSAITVKDGSTSLDSSYYTATFKKSATSETHQIEVKFKKDLENSTKYTVTLANDAVFNKVMRGNDEKSASFTTSKPDFTGPNAGLTAAPTLIENGGPGKTTLTVKGQGLKVNADKDDLSLAIYVVGPNGFTDTIAVDTDNYSKDGIMDVFTVADYSMAANATNATETYTFTLKYTYKGTEIDPNKKATVDVEPKHESYLTAENLTTSVEDLVYGYTATQAKAQGQKIKITNGGTRTLKNLSITLESVGGSGNGSDFKSTQTTIATLAANGESSFEVYLDQDKIAGTYAANGNIVVKIEGTIDGTTTKIAATVPLIPQVVTQAAGTGTEAYVVGDPTPSSDWINQKSVKLTPKVKDTTNDKVLSWKYVVSTSSDVSKTEQFVGGWNEIATDKADTYNFPADSDTTYYVHTLVTTQNFTDVVGMVEAGSTKTYNVDLIAPEVISMSASRESVGKGDFTVTFKFSEPIMEVPALSSIDITNGTATEVKKSGTGMDEFIVTITPDANLSEGDKIKIVILPGAGKDKAGNPSKGSGDDESLMPDITFSETNPMLDILSAPQYDTERPSFDISAAAGDVSLTGSKDLFGASNKSTALANGEDVTQYIQITDVNGAAVPQYTAIYTKAADGENANTIAVSIDTHLLNDQQYTVTIKENQFFNALENGNVKTEKTFYVAIPSFEGTDAGLSADPKRLGANEEYTNLTIKGNGLAINTKAKLLTLQITGQGPDGFTYTSPLIDHSFTFNTVGSGTQSIDMLTIENVKLPKNDTSQTREYVFELSQNFKDAGFESTDKKATVYVDPPASLMLAMKNEPQISDLTYGYTSSEAQASYQTISVKNNGSRTVEHISITRTGTDKDKAVVVGTIDSLAPGVTETVVVHPVQNLHAGEYFKNNETKIQATGTVENTTTTVSSSVPLAVQKVVSATAAGDEGIVTGNPQPEDLWISQETIDLTAEATKQDDSVKEWKYFVSTADDLSGITPNWTTVKGGTTDAEVTFDVATDDIYYIHWQLDTNNYAGLAGLVTHDTSGATLYKIDRIVPKVTEMKPLVSHIGKGDFDVLLTFSEGVTDFAADGSMLDITNAQNVVVAPVSDSLDSHGNPTQYKVTITPQDNLEEGDTVTLAVKAGAVVDKAGNPNPATDPDDTIHLEYSSDRPVITFSFSERTEPFLNDQTEFRVLMQSQGRENNKLYDTHGVELIDGDTDHFVTITRTHEGTTETVTGTSVYKTNHMNHDGVFRVDGNFTDGIYTVTTAGDFVKNREGNYMKPFTGTFEVRNVTVGGGPEGKEITIAPASQDYTASTPIEIAIYGTNLQHVKPENLYVTAVESGEKLTNPDISSDGTKAVFHHTLPENATDQAITYHYKGAVITETLSKTDLAVSTVIEPAYPTFDDGFDLTPLNHKNIGGTSNATVTGINLQNFYGLRLEVIQPDGTVSYKLKLSPESIAGTQTLNGQTKHEANDTAVLRTDRVQLLWDDGGTPQLLEEKEVTVDPSVPMIHDFSASYESDKNVTKLTVGNKGGEVTFDVKGTYLHNFTPLTLEDTESGSTISGVKVASDRNSAKATIKFAENKSAEDVIHEITLHYTDQGQGNAAEIYSTKIYVTVQGSYPVVRTLTATPNYHKATGGTSTLTIDGLYLDNFDDFKIVDHTSNRDIPVTVGNISTDADRTSATLKNVDFPAWDSTNLRNDIYLLEVYTAEGPTGVTAEVEVGDFIPNITGVKASPNEFKDIYETLGAKGRVRVVIEGNYLYNFSELSIYDELYNTFYTVANAEDQTAVVHIQAPSIEGIFDYQVFAEGEETPFTFQIAVGTTLGESGEGTEPGKPGDPGEEEIPDEQTVQDESSKKYWTGAGGGSKGRSFTGRHFVGFDVLEYQAEQTAKANPKDPIVFVPDVFFITKEQIDLAANGARRGARDSEQTGEGKLTLVFDTSSMDNSDELEGRLYIDVHAAIPDLYPGVFTEEDAVKETRKLFKERFNQELQVISLGQHDKYGNLVEIAADVDLEDLDTETLYFYRLDRITGEYEKIVDPDEYIDDAGYLHFMTRKGGDIVVTDKPLSEESGVFESIAKANEEE